MNAQEHLRQEIDQQQTRLRVSVPQDRQSAILALLSAQDRLPLVSASAPLPGPDLITGRRLAHLGGNKALQLCLEANGDIQAAPDSADHGWDGWAERFLHDCRGLTEAELVLAHCETGFMRLVDAGNGTLAAWIATKRPPASWRERADIDWWAAWLAKQHEPELRALQDERPGPQSGSSAHDAYDSRLADVRLRLMAYQLGYPPDAEIDGCTVQTYSDVLGLLIAWALRAGDRGEVPAPQSEPSLAAALASTLAVDAAVISRAVAAFTLDRENAGYHATGPSAAAPPLIRIDPDRLIWSIHGLTAEPFFFLTRELRRRAAREYHNTAHLRETVFRQDLYALFPDKRFVTSTGRIALRRDGGDVRTDVDAVVFDRKTGALGIFELKSQDPFARSTAELTRQRDAFLYANRQLSGVLAWLQRHGGDELLNRVDPQTARRFRVRKVFPFVLGRYLAHVGDGAEPDRRAAWGTWPQVLRLSDGQPFRASDGNPLAALFTRLGKDDQLIRPPADGSPREIALGPTRVFVYPTYTAFQASAPESRDLRTY